MTATETRLAELANEHLDLASPSLDRTLADSGVSSLAAVAFLKAVSSEFGVSVEIGDLGDDCNLSRIAAHIDAQ